MEAVANMTFESGVRMFLQLVQQEIERQVESEVDSRMKALQANQQPPVKISTNITMKILGVKRNTITRYIKNGKLDLASEGRPMMFYKKQVEELAESLKKWG